LTGALLYSKNRYIVWHFAQLDPQRRFAALRPGHRPWGGDRAISAHPITWIVGSRNWRKLFPDSLATEIRVVVGTKWISNFVDRFKFLWKVIIPWDYPSAIQFRASARNRAIPVATRSRRLLRDRHPKQQLLTSAQVLDPTDVGRQFTTHGGTSERGPAGPPSASRTT